jgi:hypothetical protein
MKDSTRSLYKKLYCQLNITGIAADSDTWQLWQLNCYIIKGVTHHVNMLFGNYPQYKSGTDTTARPALRLQIYERSAIYSLD